MLFRAQVKFCFLVTLYIFGHKASVVNPSFHNIIFKPPHSIYLEAMDRLKTLPGGTVIVKNKSWVASRFTLIEEAGVSKRRCKFDDCNKEYSRGTSHMILKRHWSKQHNDEPPTSLRPSNTSNLTEPDANYKPTKKRPLNANNLTTPNNGIKNKLINQNIGSNSTRNKLSSNDKRQLDVKLVAKRLKEAASIHLTFDIYTAKKGGKSYGIITANTVSDSLDIRSVLLEYKHLPYPDDSTAVFEFLRSCITKFNIREKIISLVSNCSNTIAIAVQEMDKRFRISKNFNFTAIHIRCFPQFVHQNVQEVLRSQETLIESVRKVVSLINNSNVTLRPQNNSNTTSETVAAPNNFSHEDNNINSNTVAAENKLKLPFDSRNCWSTTYHMIETVVQQREIIEPTLLYFQNPQDLTSINIDWDRLYTLIQLLKPFHEVVSKLVNDNYAPVSLIAVSIPHLMDHLSSSSWAYYDLVMAAHNFKLQLESYQQLFQSDLTVIAGLLDPRIKDTFIAPEGRNDAIEMLRKRVDNCSKSDVPIHRNDENSIFTSIFRHYNPDEIADYLESPRVNGGTNIIAFWESYKHVYPCLFILARALLCVQATSVPGDRMFSAAEHTDRERKIQVDGTNSKELMKSWAKYLEK